MAAAATKQTFTWEGKDKSGKIVKGEMSSKSADLVKAQLRRQGITPVAGKIKKQKPLKGCLLYTSPSPRDRTRSRMPSSA